MIICVQYGCIWSVLILFFFCRFCLTVWRISLTQRRLNYKHQLQNWVFQCKMILWRNTSAYFFSMWSTCGCAGEKRQLFNSVLHWDKRVLIWKRQYYKHFLINQVFCMNNYFMIAYDYFRSYIIRKPRIRYDHNWSYFCFNNICLCNRASQRLEVSQVSRYESCSKKHSNVWQLGGKSLYICDGMIITDTLWCVFRMFLQIQANMHMLHTSRHWSRLSISVAIGRGKFWSFTQGKTPWLKQHQE